MKTIEDKFGKIVVHDPQECYFAIVSPDLEDFPSTLIFISDKDTWDKNKYSGRTYFEDNILPEEMIEYMECVWESDLSTQQLKQMLLEVGFTYCSEMESKIDELN